MPAKSQPASKLKVALIWALLLGNIVFWIGFWLWHSQHQPAPPRSEAGPSLFRSIVMLVFGGLFLVAGVGGYLIVIFTNCLTFNFSRPVWSELKVKMYFANIFVPLGVALGVGLALSAFLTPVLLGMGVNDGIAGLLPVLGMVGLLQVAQMWILIWSPLERRVVTRRLAAMGITSAQLQNAVLTGLSNPTRSSFKKFGAVEEDIGALWVGPDQLIYYGDSEQLAFTREQVTQIERKADAGSTTILSGTAHVILHVKQPDGSERQIRLHTEGVSTMGQKRRAMDELADSITNWHTATTTPAA
jgi:hypothetical protein